MARPRRLDPEMGVHHVYTRGTKRWTIFHDDVDRRRFIGQLSTVCDRYDLAVLAFALMDNHVHLVVRCPQARLSDALRDLKSVYARYFNGRHRSSGPLFEGRFGSKLVVSHRQLRTLIRYVHRNPYSVDPHLDLVSFAWSSHGICAGARPAPVWFDARTACSYFTNYRREIERPLPGDAVQNPWPPAASAEVPGTSALAPAAVSISDILIAVARAGGVDIADVTPDRRNGLIGLAVILALGDAGLAPSEAVEPLGYRSYKAMMAARARSERRVRDDEMLAAVLSAARSYLHRRAA